MIDLVLGQKSDAFERMAKLLGITLWYLPSREAAWVGGNAKLLLADGQDPALRAHLEKGRANAVVGLEVSPTADGMHARRAGLNQVLAAILAKRNAVVLFDHRLIREAKGARRAELIGRMQQNVELCRKYRVRMGVVTMAKTPFDLRAPSDLRSFCVLLGMQPGEINAAFGALL